MLELEGKATNRVYDLFLLVTGQGVVEGQAHEAVADAFGHGQVAGSAAKALPHIRKMQRQVMEDAIDATFTQVGNEFLSQIQTGQQEIEHVIRLLTMRGDVRQAHLMRSCPVI